jgi:type II secretory pathway component GspD/PulD (secretin)
VVSGLAENVKNLDDMINSLDSAAKERIETVDKREQQFIKMRSAHKDFIDVIAGAIIDAKGAVRRRSRRRSASSQPKPKPQRLTTTTRPRPRRRQRPKRLRRPRPQQKPTQPGKTRTRRSRARCTKPMCLQRCSLTPT